MIKSICCSLVSVLATLSIGNAQTMAGGLASKGMDMQTSQSGMGVIQEVDFSDKRILGHGYLFDDYQPCKVYSGENEFLVALNFNLAKRQYEVREGEKVKIYAMSSVDRFVDPANAVYLPAKTIRMADGIPLEGVVKQTTENKKCNLLTYYSVVVKESNYVAAMDVGEKNATMKKKEDYFLLLNGTAYKVYSARKRTVNSLPLNSELRAKIDGFIKEKNLNLKTQPGAFLLAEFINTI